VSSRPPIASALGRVAALSRGDRRLAVRAWLLLLAIVPAVRFLPFRRLLALLEAAPGARRREPVSPERLVQLVEAAARHHVFTPTCLHRALTLYRLLIVHGEHAELVIGTRRAGARLEAHAWLERTGQILGDAAGPAAYHALLRWVREDMQ
jgi:hypothetical protein